MGESVMPDQAIIEHIAKNISPEKRDKLRVGVLVSGGGSNLQALIDFSKTKESHFVINSVITNRPGSFALVRASNEGIEGYLVDHHSFKDRTLFDEQLVSVFQKHGVELVVCAGFMRVLTPKFLQGFPQRVINLHPSLLPKHRGLHAIKNALIAFDKETGCTVHLVDEGLDTGPIIAQSSCPIYESDDLEMVKKRIQSLEHALLPEIVNQIAKIVTTRDFL